jgi:hypothetical protein
MAKKPASVAPSLPDVTTPDALDDFQWFADHQGRRYRSRPGAGGTWIIRRRGGAFLRTWSADTILQNLPDRDAVLRPAWFHAAYPTLDKRSRDQLTKEAKAAET